MRVFVTGASGWVGSAVVPELLAAGHQVVGLARSGASADAIAAAGAEVRRGDLDDLDALRAGAADSDGVIHLAYIHDFTQMQAAARADLEAIRAMAGELEGSDRPLVIASGTLGLTSGGRAATEQDGPDPAAPVHPRQATAQETVRLADRGIRSVVLRLPPTVHGDGDHGFIATLVGVAGERGASGYVGDGANAWSAVHRLDAATLYRLAVESAPAGSVLHGVGEQGIATREIAEAIGRQLDVPVVSVAPEVAVDHFGWIGRFFALDATASSEHTRELLGWSPTHPGLVADLDAGYYVSR